MAACCIIGENAQGRRLRKRRRAAPLFVPVAIAKTNEMGGSEGAPKSASPRRMIEIETGGARVHVPEGVDAKTLSVVLAALRRTS